jgi:outer membrane protein OmpA-like peptidoglycan-associated protein
MKNILNILILIFSFALQAQKKDIQKANTQYEKFAYIDAIKIYEKVIEKGYYSSEILEKLANSYYFNANYIKAAASYKKLLELDNNVNPEYYYRYAQSLKSSQNYDLANQMMNQFVLKTKLDNRANNFKAQGDYLNKISEFSGKYEVKNTESNSKLSDFGASFFDNKIVFASTRDSVGAFVRKHSWNNQPFSNLFVADIQEEGKLNNIKHFSKDVNTKYHESTPVFTKDGKTMYFTRNIEVKINKNSNFILSIYQSNFINGKWSNAKKLPFNGNFISAHPALSNDEKTLYFSSNKNDPKGFGDLYKVAINEDGTFGEPVNLGETINTKSRETFPFISKDNILYFASDGHPGLGGLDVFAAKINEDGSFQKPINLGKPINTEQDDFAFIINSDTKNGYLSSNRKSDNYGDDDIYFIKQLENLPEEIKQKIEGKILDKLTNLPLAQAKVVLLNQEKVKISETISNEKGEFTFENIKANSNVYVNVSKDEYLTTEELILIPNEKGTTYKTIIIDKQIKKVTVGTDLAKTLEIKMIYFDLDKHNIRPDAAVELSKILIVLQENPTIKIEVRSHTDSRNSNVYNQNLSQRRAKSTMDWLINNGIDKNRLSAQGFGETKLINECGDNVNCTEDAHQLNRRSEFIIRKLGN